MSETSPQSGQLRIERRGLLLVLSSPSGAGKTTLAGRLTQADPSLSVSVSVTTRAPRQGEVDGKDYIFIDRQDFERRKQAGDLIEWAEVHGNFYATPRAPVLRALAHGRDMLFDIDWQGARQLKAETSADMVGVFILPPDAATLERRLKTRAQDSEAVVSRRLAAAASEIAHWRDYDYVIVNADLEASLAGLRGILAAERLKRVRQIGLERLVAGLLSDL
ncbi:MAG TPA: guanylate kinase [Hyphomicrobiaceae bacterium]|nr:guanylate kinase [Hyphomicrobiaceae bacterium]